MKLHDDFTTLSWVKGELDETLKQARQALEAYVDEPTDASLMRFCSTYLHQAQGTLRMVELYGAAMLVEEMERLADALLADQVAHRDEGYSVLMRGMVQLPDYLERVQTGHKDIPIVLLPLLNDLRACRGEKLLTDSALFAPNLELAMPAAANGLPAELPMKELRGRVIRLRLAFQAALLKWFKDSSDPQHPARLRDVLDRLRTTTASSEHSRQLFWIAGGVADAISDGSLESSASVKLLFGGVDREIRHFAEDGEQGLRIAPPKALLQNLLYYIAHSGSQSPRVIEIRDTYALGSLLPTDQEVEHAKSSISGHNRALLDTVSIAIKDDLMRVKESLDIYLRAQQRDPADLLGQVELLDRVRDTLGMLGLGVPRRVVTEQRATIEEIAQGHREADEGTLLDVAGALLYVEASLDDHIERLGAVGEEGADEAMELPKAEVRKILDALMHEAAVNIQQAKHDVIAFIESPWDHERVEQIPRLLEEISGALRMLDLGTAAELMSGIVRFVEVELIRHRRVPTAEQMDKLADALASIEYYLEATRDQRGGRQRILDVTRVSLESLGYWPIPSGGGEDGPGSGGSSDTDSPINPQDAIAAAAALAYSENFELDAGAVEGNDKSNPIEGAEAGAASEFPSWGEHLPVEQSAALRPESDRDSSEINLDGLDFAESDHSDIPSTHDTEAVTSPQELDEVIEIAEGEDLSGLIVGEAGQDVAPEQDVGGLRLAETTHDREGSAQAADVDSGPAVQVDADGSRWIEIEEEIEEEVEEEVAADAADASFQITASNEIDDEIRDVFIEEVQEEIDNLSAQLPLWRSKPDDLEQVKPIRRSFHTLKGSGRLVGALSLGEFSWKVENMLNRVLDRSIAPSAQAMALVEHAIGALPGQLAALRGDGAPDVDLQAIIETADRLAEGELVSVPTRAVALTTVKRIVKRTVTRRIPAPETVEIAPTEMPTPVELETGQSSDIVAGPLPGLDPVLFDILKSETAMHLAVFDDFLAKAGTSDVTVSEPLLRAAHTLSGAIAMVEINSLAHLLSPLEGYLKRMRASAIPVDAEGFAVLGESAGKVREVMACLDRGDRELPDTDDLATRVINLRDTLHEPESALQFYHQDDDIELDTESAADPELDSTEQALASLDDVDDEVSATEMPDPSADLDEESEHFDLTEALIEGMDGKDEVVAEESTSAQSPPPGVPADTDFDALVEAASALSGLPDKGEEAAESDIEAISLDGDETIGETLDLDDLEASDEFDLSDLESLAEDDSEQDPDSSDLVQKDALDSVADAGEIEESVESGLPDEDAAEDSADTSAEDQTEDETVAETDEEEHAEVAQEPVAEAEIEAAAESITNEHDIEQVSLEAISIEPSAYAEDIQPAGRLELPEMDEDLLDIFVQEGNDILDHSDSVMAQLREAPQDREIIVNLQRDLHTLKGGARMAGIHPIGDLTHAMESLLDATFDGHRSMDITAVEALERSYDTLHSLVQRIAHRSAIATPENMISRLENLVAGETLSEAEAPAHADPEVSEETDVATTETARVSSRPPLLPEFEEEPRAPQEMIRVRSELLDSLVNYAGEVSIYRSRLEQQISTFRFNLIEFEQTVSRLREQLRKLEIETEAQIIARYQREHHEGVEQVFDPLELDRFSQLQQYSRALGESVSDLVSIQGLLDDLTRQSETLLLQQSRVSSDLQEGLMRTRMVPFDSMVPSLRRTVRQAAQELGKRAQLKVEGAQGEMDRNLLERMKAPFEHMLRNALAHGIETPQERLDANKPLDGTVTIRVSRESTEVALRISDDGRGMDRDAIRRKAIAQGLLSPDANLSDRDLYGFILETGFSTAEQVTQLSGRGVGMDVVHSEIKQLGGSLVIDSIPGTGSTFTIRLPFTLAVTQAILVKLGDATYAVPMSSVQGVVRIALDDYSKRVSSGEPTYTYAGEDFNIYELSQLLGVAQGRIIDETQLPLLMTRTGDQRAAVRIDAVVGSREIVVKSVGPQISSVPGIFGATIMGDGSVIMILDLAPLVRRVASLRASVAAGETPEAAQIYQAPELPAVVRKTTIMVVDDSITMRKVTTRVLERADMEVVTAKDGLDAVEKLQDTIPDLMLLDIEMPRMDGYELATYMRNDSRLKNVPIIMVTSRTGEKHRQRALEIGVERYLGKPYQEADLLAQVQDTLRSTSTDA
ncbi:MAG TPA: Hpt domain-containing protein [Dokdonella sp.]|uniref:hybrid sensor histidine kinase/response regulator n=1 Tax=Dokdonella sp. TaxID=2291710 RepID=UPI002D7FC140|nr:Hpt domain-containing protein [Dokdonella sp.]HET9034311.1 Hpt domain-containing protein [Dokdonella sp.]